MKKQNGAAFQDDGKKHEKKESIIGKFMTFSKKMKQKSKEKLKDIQNKYFGKKIEEDEKNKKIIKENEKFNEEIDKIKNLKKGKNKYSSYHTEEVLKNTLE